MVKNNNIKINIKINNISNKVDQNNILIKIEIIVDIILKKVWITKILIIKILKEKIIEIINKQQQQQQEIIIMINIKVKINKILIKLKKNIKKTIKVVDLQVIGNLQKNRRILKML
jgi:hypothetical protein